MTGLISANPLRVYARRLKQQSIFYRPGTESNIFLFAQRRGGSTILAQAIASESGIWFANEPLACFRGHQEYQTRIKWLPLLPDSQFFDLSQEQERQLERYLEALLTLNLRQVGKCFRPKFPLTANRVLLKVLNAPFLIDWFAQRQPCQVLFMPRHPAAQVFSVLSTQWKFSLATYFAKPEFLAQYFTAAQIQLGEKMIKEGNSWQQGIVTWILEVYFPLYLAKQKILRLTYEELTLDPVTVLNRISQELNLKQTDKIIDRMKRPSWSSIISTESSRQLVQKGDRNGIIRKWQEQITPEQIRQAQSILEVFNIDIYSMDDPMPKPKYLINTINP